MPEWTSEQKKAIDSRDGTILVSAAAGSGKTAVLVERVLRRLMDTEKPCSAERLLIVTFTRAATQQMKERIFQALNKELRADPDNKHLKHQLVMLPSAKISTIDGFCNDIVRENFHDIDLTPDYKMLEGAQLKIMQADAIGKTLDELYRENSDEFVELVNVMASGTDDSSVGSLIQSLYENSRAFANPEKWLDGLMKNFNEDCSLADSKWGKLIISKTMETVEYCTRLCGKMFDCLSRDDMVAEKYNDNIVEVDRALKDILLSISQNNWDVIRDSILNVSFSRMATIRGEKSYDAIFVADSKKEIQEKLDSLKKLFCATESENKDDLNYLRPVAQKLILAVKRYGEILMAEKIKINSFDFSDIAHFALHLLVEFDEDGNPHKTGLAEIYSGKFDEILVDEFQDINDMQDILFSAISKDESNLFTVGDVKQSIYRFRQAMPEIFLRRRDNLDNFEDGNYPAKITLDRNFRSRKGVTENINFVFRQLMSRQTSGIDYNDDEALVAAADYDEADFVQTELHIVGDLNNNRKISREYEAQHIADKINEMISSGMLVKDSDGYRPVKYKDFCILMRSAKGRAEKYADILTKNNIPVFLPDKAGFFSSIEISTMINLIRVIDNPIQDIPLLAIMFSPLFGFTADELSIMRINERKKPIYHCVIKSADNGNEKSKSFLKTLERLRMLSSTLSCSEFVRELYDVTGCKAVANAMKNGSQRNANLNMLLDYAQKYEDSGKRGISGFIRFIDRVQRQNADLESASDVSEAADVVRIMTIHKSKGLEFPICILADVSARFMDDSKGIASYHPEYGICFNRRDSRKKCTYDTVGKKAIGLAEKDSNYAEELRVLYVALTRAKEKLICVVRWDNYQKKLSELALEIEVNGGITPFSIHSKATPAEWLMMAFLRHPDANILRVVAGFDSLSTLPCAERMNVEIFNDTEIKETTALLALQNDFSEELLEQIREKTEYRYPYSALSQVRAKSSPSEFDTIGFNSDYFARTKPQFLSKSGMNPASRGTATHKFMEFFDYNADFDIDSQTAKMLEDRHISEDEVKVLEKDKLKKFFDGEIARRIKASPLLLREKKVTVEIPAKVLYPTLEGDFDDENVLIQGYVDCAFEEDGELVIVDYKTDRGASADELRERYGTQLKMYEFALKKCTGKNIRCTLIYSFDKGEYIEL